MNRKRIQRLVSVRQRIQGAGQAALASVQRSLRNAEAEEGTERQRAIEAGSRLGAATQASASELVGLAGQVEHAQRRIASAAERRTTVAEQVEAVRVEVVDLVHETRRMEALLERLVAEDEADRRRREQRDLDEVAARMRRPL